MEATVATPRSTPSPRVVSRTVITYLAVVAVDTWALFLAQDLQMGRDVLDDARLGTSRFVGSALVFVPIVAALLIPAAVLTRALAWRRPPASGPGRALAGAVAWAGWGTFVAVGASSAGGLVYFAGSMLGAVGLLALSGALFAVVGLGKDAQPPGRLAIGTGLAVAAVVIALSLFMAGRWGGPA